LSTWGDVSGGFVDLHEALTFTLPLTVYHMSKLWQKL